MLLLKECKMSRKKKKKITEQKPTYNYFWQETVVTEILEKNKCYGDKIKNAFKCESSVGEPRTCIYWERLTDILQVGSRVSLKGRIQGNAFLCIKVTVYPDKKQEVESV